MLSLDDACRLVGARGRLMGALPAGGLMVAVEASEEDVLPLLSDGVSVAAVNGPSAVVVSGVEEEVLALVTQLGVRSRRLRVSHAFHSPLMEPMLVDFRAVVEDLSFGEPWIPMVSSGDVTSAEYWVRHVRDTVRFADSINHLKSKGVTHFVEVGPDAVLTPMVAGCVPTLRKDRPEPESLLTAVARLHVEGVSPD
ncbi:acyltransferase domain-containing protein, partial [Kibdelosporangium lantanae]